MTLQQFLTQISDSEGAMQMLAAETMERMSPDDFVELIREITNYLEQEAGNKQMVFEVGGCL